MIYIADNISNYVIYLFIIYFGFKLTPRKNKFVLKAQELGLNTCWVAMTHGKSAAEIRKGEKLACIIALGYGADQGTHKRSRKGILYKAGSRNCEVPF